MGCCGSTSISSEFDNYFKKKITFNSSLPAKISSVEDLTLSKSELLNDQKSSIFQDFEILNEVISAGNSSIIKKAIHKLTGTVVAVKIIKKQVKNLYFFNKAGYFGKNLSLTGLTIKKSVQNGLPL